MFASGATPNMTPRCGYLIAILVGKKSARTACMGGASAKSVPKGKQGNF